MQDDKEVFGKIEVKLYPFGDIVQNYDLNYTRTGLFLEKYLEIIPERDYYV